MWKISLAWIVLMTACIGSSTTIDLGDYILSTGDHVPNPGDVVSGRNSTTGLFGAMIESSGYTIALTEVKHPMDKKNFTTAKGYSPVTKPYPGFIKTSGTVSYIGQVSSNLILAVVCQNVAAMDLLKNLKVSSRKSQSDDLIKALA